jgi:outer membrane protein assembly factor BamB
MAVLVLAAAIFFCTQLMASENNAEAIVTKTGVAGGLISFPQANAADESLMMELAKRPSMIVHATVKDQKLVAHLREAGEAAGILGRSLYVEFGDAARTPYADRMVDLMIVSDLTEADLKPELRSEWLRVLTPRRGAIFFSRNANILRAELPAGSDSWTHRNHGADNVQVSNDSTFKAPFLSQWWSLPRMEGTWGTAVVSDKGRLFTIRSSRRSNEPVILSARSLANGLVLWQKKIRPAPEGQRIPLGGYVPGRSCIAVNGDNLYIIDRDAVAILDAETGRGLERIIGPRPDGNVKWLAISQGKLAVLSGEIDRVQAIKWQTVCGNPIGRDLAVYDLATKKQLWRDTITGDIDERALALRDGRIIYLAQGVGVVCRNLVDGTQLWKNNDEALQVNFQMPDQSKTEQFLGSEPIILALEEVLILRSPLSKNVYALSAKDGATLWNRPSGMTYRSVPAVPVNGLWLGPDSVDLKTGKPATGPKYIFSGCGTTLATPDYLITCFGAMSDLKNDQMIRKADLKGICDLGSVLSEGILITVPNECHCELPVKCYRALVSGGAIDPHSAPPTAERLTILENTDPSALPLTDADWPTYRHDAARSAASSASLNDGAQILWQWKPNGVVQYKTTWDVVAKGPRIAPDFIASAPIAASGMIYFISADGFVRCLKASDGKEIWKFATAAMSFAPPTIWEGRILVGSSDGRVYCLDASTGKPLWNLLLAPHDRRIFWNGHLINTWPVIGGVTVKDGVGYAVSGYTSENGIHAYAFDPKTGKVLWEKHDAGTAGMASDGGIAINGGRLCIAGISGGSFDLKTGEWKIADRVTASVSSFGGEIIGLCGKWALSGGRRLTELQSDVTSPIMDHREFPMGLPCVTSLPAWDAQIVVFGPSKINSSSLLAAETEKFVTWKSEELAAKSKTRKGDLSPVKFWESTTPGPGTPAAFVLAKNAVVAAFVGGPKASDKLVALKRTDGTASWSVDLPEQPAMNQLAIDRDGRVLVGLCDGSVICVGK